MAKQIPMLNKGDTVALMCPASPKKPTQDLAKVVEAIEALGFNVLVYPSASIGETYDVPYLALSDKARAEEIMSAFLDEKIKGIICFKGGYGSSRILDLLDYQKISEHPKFFTGYSDITSLLNAFYFKSQIVSFQGFLGISLIDKDLDQLSKDNIKHVLFDKQIDTVYPYGKYISLNHDTVQGELVGGNLSLFVQILGSEYLPNVKNKIVFLEDVDEETYSLDRMFTKLKLFHVFEDAKAIILGYFTNAKEKEAIAKLIKTEFSNLTIPVLAYFPSGHEMPFISLPIGSIVEVSSSGLKIVSEVYQK